MRTAVVAAAALLAACPRVPSTDDEELGVEGSLERDGIGGVRMDEVPIDYRSTGARGEWWPCDLRLTAGGCIDDKHVNVYVALPSATTTDDVGGAACVDAEGVPFGVFELVEEQRDFDVGSELQVFVLVASDTDGNPGALLDDDAETKAASRLASGRLSVERLADDGAMTIVVDGTTSGDHPVRIVFGGPVSQPGVVPPLEGPSTCVDSALVAE